MHSGWPVYERKIAEIVRDFLRVIGKLKEVDDLVVRGICMRTENRDEPHGHQGLVKCRDREIQSVSVVEKNMTGCCNQRSSV